MQYVKGTKELFKHSRMSGKKELLKRNTFSFGSAAILQCQILPLDLVQQNFVAIFSLHSKSLHFCI